MVYPILELFLIIIIIIIIIIILFFKNMELPLIKFYEHKALTLLSIKFWKIIAKSYEGYKVIKMTSSFS